MSEPKQPYFRRLLAPLAATGLPLPAPLAAALAGEVKPLALSTRLDLPQWTQAHGYDAQQADALKKVIGARVNATAYRRALIEDLAVRTDLDDNAVEAVRPEDRHAAALALYMKQHRATDAPLLTKPTGDVAGTPVDALLPASAPAAPPPSPPRSPVVPPAVAAAVQANATRPKISLP